MLIVNLVRPLLLQIFNLVGSLSYLSRLLIHQYSLLASIGRPLPRYAQSIPPLHWSYIGFVDG